MSRMTSSVPVTSERSNSRGASMLQQRRALPRPQRNHIGAIGGQRRRLELRREPCLHGIRRERAFLTAQRIDEVRYECCAPGVR